MSKLDEIRGLLEDQYAKTLEEIEKVNDSEAKTEFIEHAKKLHDMRIDIMKTPTERERNVNTYIEWGIKVFGSAAAVVGSYLFATQLMKFEENGAFHSRALQISQNIVRLFKRG